MRSSQPRTLRGADRAASPTARRRPDRGPLRISAKAVEAVPDESIAVVLAGPAGDLREALLTALVGEVPAAPEPGSGFLVVSHGPDVGVAAHIPGYRQPHAFTDASSGGPVPARPPRRVTATLPDPLLRHFQLVDTPDTSRLGVAGARVVLDAARRGGALLFVLPVAGGLSQSDLDLLAGVAEAGCTVFFAVLPETSGWAPPSHRSGPVAGGDPTAAAQRRLRAAVAARVPALADAGWFVVDALTGDIAYLRRALIEWADREGLARASRDLAPVPAATRAVPVTPGAYESAWADRLDRQLRTAAHRLRQRLAIELANIHLRCVQGIVFGAGPAGLPADLDRELEALSLTAVREGDRAVAAALDEVAGVVFGEAPDEGVRRRISAAVRRGFADHRVARDLERVLLVTSTGGVAVVTGSAAVSALAACPGPTVGPLPPVGVALSGGCYQLWANPGNDDPARARSWLQRALREVEVELGREVARRFEAVRLSMTALLADAVDHGILLA
ncbi:hypothetical protein ACFFWC_00460 [Plantactinospora siamensis]|uniref:Uncharacterized protein n=1 Tax=Plantactinospora siamensis TaxID=555372 RepID=A0ABV6NTQ5_9ACTN